MTSLQGSLPDSASGLWRMDREYGVSNTRVKHVVIHEAHIRESPDRHVVYRIDVFTQERNWCVYRRYSEFRKLHEKVSECFKMFKGSFPPKQLSGNLSPAVIEQRRSSLEHYLLKIVNSHNQDVSSSPTVLRFLDLPHNDVYYVTSALCRYVRTFGEAILNEGHYFVLSPTQLFCVHKRLRIPNSDADYKADTVFCDLGSLYDFLGRLTKVCIKPANLQDQGIRSEISLLKSVKELQIQTFSVSLVKGLAAVQLQIQRLKASQAVTAMKDLLIDCVLERKTQVTYNGGLWESRSWDLEIPVAPKQPQNREREESSTKMRDSYNSKMIFNSYTIHPWISLLYLDLSHNSIRQLDDSFSLLPNLQELDLSYNQIEILDLNFVNPALTKLVCSHSSVMKVITKTHDNLTELILSHNQLTELTGFNKIILLRKLDLFNNSITSVDNIACLTELPRLHDIAIAENPLSKSRSYRNKVLCMFTQACRKTDILVDGKGFSEKEKKKAKSTRVRGTNRQGPSTLPFFGSDQVPTAFSDPSQDDTHWNSILHDSSITESSHSDSEVAELAEEEVPLSPTLSEIRSTPSQTRTYDWDPAQAFASSANSTPPPQPFPLIPGVGLVGGSLQDSPAGSAAVLGEECESLEPVSPMTEEGSLKHFNSSYYSLTGSSDLFSTAPNPEPDLFSNPLHSTSDPSVPIPSSSHTSKSRVNPFGEPESVSGSSRDLSDSSEEYFNTGESVGDTAADTAADTAGDTAEDATGDKAADTAGGTAGEIGRDGLSLDLAANDRASVSDYETPGPGPAPLHPSIESERLALEEHETESKTVESQCETKEGVESNVTPSAGGETFVVDRPDYDDIIFAGGTSPHAVESSSSSKLYHVTTSTEHVTTRADHVTSADHVTTRADHVTTRADHVTTRADHVTTRADHVITRADHVTKRADHAISADHVTSTEHVTTRADHVTARADHVTKPENKDQAVHSGTPDFISDSPVDSPAGSLLRDDSPVLSTQPSSTQQGKAGGSSSVNTSVSNSDDAAVEESVKPASSLDNRLVDSPVAQSQLMGSPVAQRQLMDSPASQRQLMGSPVAQRQLMDSPASERQAVDSPTSPGLTDHTSSGDECMSRLTKIQSLSFSKDVYLDGDLYDSEESEDQSDDLSFSNAKLQF